MKNRISYLIVPLFFISHTELSYAKEPRNLDLYKQDLIQYHDSGEYLKDQAKVINQAMRYLKSRLQTSKNKKPLAIVLDIDETSLSNYPDMLRMSFGGTVAEINDAEGKGTDPVIQPTLGLYQFAKANRVAVFFVTGRTENYREGTVRNLNDVGFTQWDGLTMKPENYNQKSAAPYKIDARQKIEAQGFDIVMSIGDQQSDLSGGHADRTFKMPNPYYLVP
jgi:predicted secreted acid phosphatase